MSHLVLMIAKIEELDNSETLTEVWRRAMPEVNLGEIAKDSYLDGLESTVTEVGWEAMRKLLVEQWRETDKLLVGRFCQEVRGRVGDGYDLLKVASRIGVVELPRQVCYEKEEGRHTLPGNAGLPEHKGQVTTRGLQEWVCLLPMDLPFATTERMLGWMTHDPEVMSETQVRRWVCQHGQTIRDAERAEVEGLEVRENLDGLQAQICPAPKPRCRPAWAVATNQAVETALAQPEPKPPEGITASDWQRVLQVRRVEATAPVESLRRLGPQVQPGEVVASVDEVLVRRPAKRRFHQLGTAYVRTAHGYRYLSGSIEMVLRQLLLLLMLCGGGVKTKVILLGDGARWINGFFEQHLADWPMTALFLDWYHCRKKCYDLTSMICHGRKAKAELLGSLLRQLWHGQVQDALDTLEAYRPRSKNSEKLDELFNYLSNRRQYIPDYQARRRQRQYIGSAHVEKGNDLIVARRQKHQGMHWSESTSDSLAALRTLMLNGGWDLYWQKQQVLPLAIPSAA